MSRRLRTWRDRERRSFRLPNEDGKKDEKSLGHFRKMEPFGHNRRCWVCHGDKLSGKRPIREGMMRGRNNRKYVALEFEKLAEGFDGKYWTRETDLASRTFGTTEAVEDPIAARRTPPKRKTKRNRKRKRERNRLLMGDPVLFAGYLVAWRAWTVHEIDGQIYLASSIAGHKLRPGSKYLWLHRHPLESTCHRKHVPTFGCSCGLYAYKDLADLQQDRPDVFGRVALWGHVVEAERGWRAQYGYPICVFVDPDYAQRHPTVIWKLHKAYGVPVGVLKNPQ